MGEKSSLRVSQRYASQSGKGLLTALRNPPSSAVIRVLLWCLPLTQVVDPFGLGLKIKPPFFEALCRMIYGDDHDRYWSFELQPLQTDHAAMGDIIATISRRYIAENANAPPVVLIAGYFGQIRQAIRNADAYMATEAPPFVAPANEH